MKDNFPYLYPYSRQDAERQGELDLWRESHRENIACKKAIEDAIRRDFDGMYLKEDCVDSVIEQYGFRRVALVLSNTIQHKSWDGRFSSGNRAWAAKTFISTDESRNRYIVESHPAVLDGFASEYRKAVQTLNLFGAEHCESDS